MQKSKNSKSGTEMQRDKDAVAEIMKQKQAAGKDRVKGDSTFRPRDDSPSHHPDERMRTSLLTRRQLMPERPLAAGTRNKCLCRTPNEPNTIDDAA